MITLARYALRCNIVSYIVSYVFFVLIEWLSDGFTRISPLQNPTLYKIINLCPYEEETRLPTRTK